jgi:hypothetical protein
MYLPRLTNGQRTSITTLIRVGFSTQTVAESAGKQNRHKTCLLTD